MNKNLLRTLENQAKKMYKSKSDISFDETTKLVVKNIKWEKMSEFKVDIEYIHLQSRYLSRLDYYYEQVLKNVSMNSEVNLAAGQYLDFWEHLEKVSLAKYFLKYKNAKINDQNLFGFLSMLKSKINEYKFINNFKLKSIEMIEVKKGFINE